MAAGAGIWCKTVLRGDGSRLDFFSALLFDLPAALFDESSLFDAFMFPLVVPRVVTVPSFALHALEFHKLACKNFLLLH